MSPEIRGNTPANFGDPDVEVSGGGRKCFVLKKTQQKILISFTPLRRSALRRPELLLRVTSQRRQAALPPDPVGFESRFPLQQNSTLMKGELGCLFPALVWEARGDNLESHARTCTRMSIGQGPPRTGRGRPRGGERGRRPRHRGCH